MSNNFSTLFLELSIMTDNTNTSQQPEFPQPIPTITTSVLPINSQQLVTNIALEEGGLN